MSWFDKKRLRVPVPWFVPGLAAAGLLVVVLVFCRVPEVRHGVLVHGQAGLQAAMHWTFAALRWIWSLIPKLFRPLTPILIFAILIVADMWRATVKIEPFDMPKTLVEAGLTPRVMGNRMGTALEELQEAIRSVAMKQNTLSYSYVESPYDLEIPATKMGLRAIIEFLRETFGYHSLRFSGDVVASSDASSKITMTIYASWGRKQKRIGRIEGVREETDALVSRSVEVLLEYANPYIFGVLLLSRKDLDGALRIGQSMVSEEKRMASRMGRKAARSRANYGHLLAGIAFTERGDAASAVEHFQRTLESDPKFVQAYNCWGLAYYRQKLYLEAVAMYAKAIEIDPQYASAYSNWGIVLYEQKLYVEAIAKYTKAIELDPNLAMAYSNWGLVLAEQKLYAEAIAKHAQAIELDPNFALAYGNWGVLLAKQGLHAEAIAKYTKAIELDPKNRELYTVWGDSLFSQKLYAEAIAKYAEAIKVDPKHARAFCNWGLVLAEQKLYAAAAEKYSQAIEADPKYRDAYVQWGTVLAMQELYKEAIAKYEQAIEVDPHHALTYRVWGYVLNAMAEGTQPEEAARALRAEADEKIAKSEELEKGAPLV